MSALDSDIGFDAILRQAAMRARFDQGADDDSHADRDSSLPKSRGVSTILAIFVGLIVVSAVTFTAGYSALLSDTPGVWIHRLMALAVAQSIVIAAIAMKLLPLFEQGRLSVSIAMPRQTNSAALSEKNRDARLPTVAPPPLPRKPVVGGKLAGREFLAHEDGSIEIDTLVGRRRFVSLDAAREFVGS